MSFLSSIGSAFNSIGKALAPLAQTALKAVAPQATDLLKNIVGSGFDAIKSAGQSLVGNIPFVGGLASKLLGKGVDSLKGLADGGIESLVKSLLSKVVGTTVDGQNVNLPAATDRLGTGSTDVSSILTQLQSIIKPATSSSTSAATAAAPSTTPATTQSAPSTGSEIDIATKALQGHSANSQQEQNLLNQIDDPKQRAMMQAQFDLQHMQETVQFISTVAKLMHETAQGTIRNIA